MPWQDSIKVSCLKYVFRVSVVWTAIKNQGRNHSHLKRFCIQTAYKNACNCSMCFKEMETENQRGWIMSMVYVN